MQARLEDLKARLGIVHDLRVAVAVLGWDRETYMPPGGAAARAEQLATLDRLAHEAFTADEIGALLEDLSDYENGQDYDSHDASLIRVTRREFRRARRVPADLVADIARAASLGQQVWVKARADSDYAHFKPFLAKNIDLRRRWAACFDVPDGGSLYDPLLDWYEPGITTAEVQTVFDAVRPALVELTAALAANRDAVDNSLLRQPYDRGAQLAFSLELARGVGYDLKRGRQDLSAHPFTTTFDIDDVRITTRVNPDYPPTCWFGTVHETGHALYDQNVDKALARTPLGMGTSMAIHESQSRLYENNLGRGRPFWEHFFPMAQAHFPDQLGGASLDAFFRAINKAGPSLIRVEADEVTYGLHVILRFELEQAMIAGEVDAADLPDLWNAKMEAYFGLTPPDDARGVMQDIHWSSALIGYFPTYLLGSIFAVQLYEAAKKDLPDMEAGFARGDFAPLLDWLRQKVHRHGSKFTVGELAERVTGGSLRPEPYVAYLRGKVAEIYGV